jgi:hypothetical protein
MVNDLSPNVEQRTMWGYGNIANETEVHLLPRVLTWVRDFQSQVNHLLISFLQLPLKQMVGTQRLFPAAQKRNSRGDVEKGIST